MHRTEEQSPPAANENYVNNLHNWFKSTQNNQCVYMYAGQLKRDNQMVKTRIFTVHALFLNSFIYKSEIVLIVAKIVVWVMFLVEINHIQNLLILLKLNHHNYSGMVARDVIRTC